MRRQEPNGICRRICEYREVKTMTKIVLVGCNGHMGRVIAQCIAQRDDCILVAGIDITQNPNCGFPVYTNADDFTGEADVIIDFAHQFEVEKRIDFAVRRKLPLVLATTGLSEEVIAKVRAAAKEIPVFFTANMSLGVNLLVELCKKAAKVLGDEFDIEIIEKHHNQKVDAPSGTALMIADAINETLDDRCHYMYDRHAVRKKRDHNEIGIHAVRGGTIVGEHEVIFAGRDEILRVSHSAMSKEIFATGSINAARFLAGREPGLYDMGDIV